MNTQSNIIAQRPADDNGDQVRRARVLAPTSISGMRRDHNLLSRGVALYGAGARRRRALRFLEVELSRALLDRMRRHDKGAIR